MKTILISGAANGLGAEFVEAYRTKPEVSIIAIDLAPISATAKNITSFKINVTSEEDINQLKRDLHDRPIDLLIHSAGVRGLVPKIEKEHPDDVAACETLEVMDTTTLLGCFQVNAAGTFTLIRALLPNLKLATDPKVIVMASRMGSIGNNVLPNKDAGSAYAYRASKAATNAIVRSFAVDVPEVTFILCHPGRVETKLVLCREEGAISAEESVGLIVPLIERWRKSSSGSFFDRFGEVIPW